MPELPDRLIMAATLLIGLVYFLATEDARADTYLDYNLGSIHSEKTYRTDDGEIREYNGVNFGLGVTHEKNEHVDVIGGLYQNSFDKLSLYAGANIHKGVVGVVLAGATGYEEYSGSTVTPYVMPNITIKGNGLKAMIGVIPGEVQVYTLQLGVAF